MSKQNRRVFLQSSAVALAAGLSSAPDAPSIGETNRKSGLVQGVSGRTQMAPHLAADDGKKPLRLGLIIGIGKDPDGAIAKVNGLGLPTCQVFADDFELEQVTRLRQALDKNKIEATSLVVGGPGKEVWDFYSGAADRRHRSTGNAGGPHGADQEGFRFCETLRHRCGPDTLRIHSGRSE